jgi:hypothetical protein
MVLCKPTSLPCDSMTVMAVSPCFHKKHLKVQPAITPYRKFSAECSWDPMVAFRLWRLPSAEAYALVNPARACVFLGPESKGTGESKRRAKAWAICTIDTRRLESLYLYGRGGMGAYETCPAEGVAHFRARTRKRVLQTPCLTQLSQLLQRPSLDPVAPPVVIVHVPQAVPDNRAAVG